MVLLIYPKHSPFPHSISAPLSIFSLGSFLESKGIEVEYFDERVQSWDILRQSLAKKPVLAGISTMTSYQIKRSLTIACYIRKNNPEIPLVWGGVQPTMCPHQTAESELVDFVIKGEGEGPLYELACALNSSRLTELASIENLVWKDSSGIRENKNRPFLDINTLPFVYSGKAGLMLDMYLRLKTSRESVAMQTSRGCNFSCGFCYNQFFNLSAARLKNKEKLGSEFYELSQKGVNELMFVDDNLGASYEHVDNVCEATKKFGMQWSGGMRIDFIDQAMTRKLQEAGCRYLFFGIESTDPGTIKYINKQTNYERIMGSASCISKSAISSVYSFMTGFPREAPDALWSQIEFIDAIRKIDIRAEFALQPYNPLPGTQLYQEALQLGFVPPHKLADWWKMTTGEVVGPWVKDKALLRNLYLVSFLAFRCRRFLKSVIFIPLYISAKARWKFKFFKFCWERVIYLITVRVCIILHSFRWLQ
jgi:anaerobic magnesium-protoporphyrin IX monomethyl ester cyclase